MRRGSFVNVPVLLAMLASCGHEHDPGGPAGPDLAQAPRAPVRAADVPAPAAPATMLALGVSPSRGQLAGSFTLPALPLRAEFDPQLSIAYDGTTVDFGEGLGAGMSLTVPSITTSPEYGLTLPRGTGADPLVMPLVYQGKRLMFVPESAEDVPEYRLEAGEASTRIYYHAAPTQLQVLGRTLAFQGMLVVHADGSREIFSEDPAIAEFDSFAGDEGIVPIVTRLPLVYRVAPSGDVIEYRYQRDPHDARTYLSSVLLADGRARYELTLGRLANPPSRSVFVQGFEQRQTRLYTRITGIFEDRVIHRTYLVYRTASGTQTELLAHDDVKQVATAELSGEIREPAPLVEESVLLAVLRYGAGEGPVTADSSRFPPLRFAYADRTFADLGAQTSVQTIDIAGVTGFGAEGGAEYLDVNQDGLVDVVSTETQRDEIVTALYVNQGTGSFRRAEGPLEVTRDGLSLSPIFKGDTSIWLPGDFDGDGVVDLVQIEAALGTGSTLTLFPGQGGGAAPFAPARASFASTRAPVAFADGRAQVADLNADGRDDLLISERNEGAWRFSVLLNRTTSVGLPGGGALHFTDFAATFEAPALFNQETNLNQSFEFTQPEVRLSDVNGDGLVDLSLVRVLGGSEVGVCVFENQGKIRVNVDGSVGPNAKDLLLFGEAPERCTGESCRNPVCAGGYYLPISGLPSLDTINALWIIDVTGDGLSDLVNLGKSNDTALVWAGRGRDGFHPLGEISLRSEPLHVDPLNRWNTRVIDVDGDGQEEITIYDPDAPDQLRVIDFNRVGDANLTPPLLLQEASEGKGLRHRVQFSTSTQEMLRDRLHGRAAPGIPFVTPVVKRLVTQLGDGPASVSEYRYHAASANLVDRGLLGFAEAEVASYGDSDAAHSVMRITYTRSAKTEGDRYFDRLLGDRESGRAVHRLELDQGARDALASADAPGALGPARLGETSLRLGPALISTASTWDTDAPPTAARAPRYLREVKSETALFGGDCTVAACAARTERAVSFDGCNRPQSEVRAEAAITGPAGGVPARGERIATTYLKPCEEAAARNPAPVALTSPTSVVRTTAAGALIERRDLRYDAGDFAPSAVTTSAGLDLQGVPPALRSAVTPLPPRTVQYERDPYLRVLASRDEAGLLEKRSYTVDQLRADTVENGGGHVQKLHYTRGEPGPTRIDTVRGDVLQLRYDPLQRLVSTTQDDGTTTHYAYREPDAVPTRRVLVSQWRGALEPGSATLYVARADGQPVAQIEPADGGGARVLELRDHGRRNRPIRAWVPLNVGASVADLFAAPGEPFRPAGDARCGAKRVTCFTYDAIGRVVERIAASEPLREQTEHPPWGRILRVSDQGGVRTRQEVARDARIHAVVDELGKPHHFTRDAAGMLTATQLDGEAEPRTSLADGLGNVLFAAVPRGMSKVFTRDARGRVVKEQIFARDGTPGGTIETRHDALDRPIARVSRGAGEAGELDVTRYDYDRREDDDADELSNVGSLVHAHSDDKLAASHFDEHFRHDRDGRLIERTAVYSDADPAHTRSYEERWDYAFDGLLAAYADPHGQRFSYALSAARDVAAITWQRADSQSVLMRATAFDAQGQPTARERPAHRLSEQARYDAATGLLSSLQSCVAGQTPCLQDDEWSRRGDGKVVAQQSPSGRADYAYTARGELESAGGDGGGPFTYRVDPAGHLLHASELAGGALVRAESPLALPAAHEVDAFGRVTRAGTTRDITYDPSGRVRSAEVDGMRLVYAYGARGDRVARKTEDALTVYPTPDTRDDGQERQSLVRFRDLPLALVVDGRVSLGLLTDHRGVVQAVVDAEGKRVGSVRTTPYGQLAAGSSASVAGLRSLELVHAFTGTLRDEASGLVHMGARSYLPSAAAFATPDPLMLSQPELCTTRLLECMPYGYAAHDPMNLVDPTGTLAVRAALKRIARVARRALGGLSGRGIRQPGAGVVGHAIGRASGGDRGEIARNINGQELSAGDAVTATRAALSAAGGRGTRTRAVSAGEDGTVITTGRGTDNQSVMLVRPDGRVERRQADISIDADGNMQATVRPREGPEAPPT